MENPEKDRDYPEVHMQAPGDYARDETVSDLAEVLQTSSKKQQEEE